MSGDEHVGPGGNGGTGRGERPSGPSRIGEAMSRRLVHSRDWQVLLLLLLALAGGGAVGLQSAFIVTLPVLVVSGLVLLIALRTYAPGVATALASPRATRAG